jgi:hypothetical protein
MQQVSIKDKYLLTVEEASAYSNIGQNTLREIIRQPDCAFCLRVKNKYLIKRIVFEKWLLLQYSI